MKICTRCKKELSLTAFGKCGRRGLKNDCRECRADAGRKAYRMNSRKSHLRTNRYHRKNRLTHPEKYEYRNEEHAERRRAIVRKHYHANRDAQRERMLKRYHSVRSPSWLSSIQCAQIEEFYDVAIARTTQMGIVHNVDHIHPVEGENFQGLHVPWNLQVITGRENIRKGSSSPSPDQHLAFNGACHG